MTTKFIGLKKFRQLDIQEGLEDAKNRNVYSQAEIESMLEL